METINNELVVVRADFSPELAAELGQLTLHLTDSVYGDPISESNLRVATDSQTGEQLIAKQGDNLLGAATLTQIGGLLTRKAWLEDFVVAPEARGQGVADAIADEWEKWCQERDITTLMFTSGWHREAAHRFYLRRGAFILNSSDDKTALFNYPINRGSK